MTLAIRLVVGVATICLVKVGALRGCLALGGFFMLSTIGGGVRFKEVTGEVCFKPRVGEICFKLGA